MAARLAGKAGTDSSVTSSLAHAKCAPFFAVEWLKGEKKSASSLKEILCNREQIAILPGGRRGVMSCFKHDLSLSSAECRRKER